MRLRPAIDMDYPNLGFLSDIDLVILQSEARKTGDQDFVNAILIELGNREKIKIDNEPGLFKINP